MKYSRSQLARSFVQLLDTHSSKDLATAFAPFLIAQSGKRDIQKFGEEVAYLSAKKQHTVLASVKSARKLSKTAQKHISSYIQHAEHMEHAHVISYTIDPLLIGGAVVETATHVYNFSVQGKLQSIL